MVIEIGVGIMEMIIIEITIVHLIVMSVKQCMLILAIMMSVDVIVEIVDALVMLVVTEIIVAISVRIF